MPQASPALRLDELVGGPAGGSPASAETPPDKDRLPALLAAQAIKDNKLHSGVIF